MRVPQPPDQSSNAGHRAAAANRGRLFFGYFLLAKQKKVTSCRATPGEVDFDFDVGLRDETANPTYALSPAVLICFLSFMLRHALHERPIFNYPFAPNIILLATNFFANGKQSSAVSAAARPALISGRSLENSRTSPSVNRIPASRSVRRRLR